MIIDHLGLVVSDVEKSKQFYSLCLEPLDISLLMEVEGWVGFGASGKPEFWFGEGGQAHKPMHIAFAAKNRSVVDEFYDRALEAGATDNGAPGIREMYHPDYYGAFVIGPDGHNIEAVCHKPE